LRDQAAPRTSTITFVQADGTKVSVQARAGMSLMEAALRAKVRGIDAKCRGNCACVTCHVYIDPRWRAVLGPPGPMEESMLDFAEDADGRSRLSCQVRIDDRCEGLTVEVPAEQRILGL
jgi:2Fe-2S ferredoxin